jgi:hypothetical protein
MRINGWFEICKNVNKYLKKTGFHSKQIIVRCPDEVLYRNNQVNDT